MNATNENEKISSQNIVKYCENKGINVFIKQAGSSNGMVFPIGDGKYLCNVRYYDLLPGPENDFVSFEVHPGITVLPEYYGLVADYTQQISSELGVIQVSNEHGDVFYKITLSITDHALSVPTISMVLDHANALLDAHYPVLNALSHGRLPSLPLNSNLKVELADGMFPVADDVTSVLPSISDWLINRSGYNIVSSCDDSWLCEIYTEDEHYSLNFDMPLNGILRIRVGYGLNLINVDEAYRSMTAYLLCKESATRKIGTLRLMDNRIYAQTELSVLEGTVSDRTLKCTAEILVSILHELHRDIELVSHGIIPEKKKLPELHFNPGIFPEACSEDDEDEEEHANFMRRFFTSKEEDKDE